jgi:hypothetical protein
MKQLYLFYDRTIANQDRIKNINASIKQQIEDDPNCQSIKIDLDGLKAKLKQAEDLIRSEYEKELEDLDGLKVEVKMDKENMSDEAIQLLLKGKLENIKKGNKEYKPVFSVKWVKVEPGEDK